jgi:protein-L-isoaspartate(D-aspartate) O-methyltransferase
LDKTQLLQTLKLHGIKNPAVLKAIENTPREHFISPDWKPSAYQNIPLPIDCGQTISQPYIVAQMTELLLQTNPKKVLEIGTGSGYQTAILAQLIPEIYTIERISTLLQQAKKHLKTLALPASIHFRCGDGSKGWPEEAPFDGILVTAAAQPHILETLLTQLNDGGRLVIPLDESDMQFLYVIDKTPEGIERRRLEAVRFVPLIEK